MSQLLASFLAWNCFWGFLPSYLVVLEFWFNREKVSEHGVGRHNQGAYIDIGGWDCSSFLVLNRVKNFVQKHVASDKFLITYE
jgi:hypothetical protein